MAKDNKDKGGKDKGGKDKEKGGKKGATA